MKIVIAPDKFRGSLNTLEVIAAITEGVLAASPEAMIWSTPLSDGGEGTMEILTEQAHGTLVSVEVNDPLNRKITAQYGFSQATETAYIEMATASGLGLLLKEEYNPLLTSTYGTGQLILDAVSRGAKSVIIGIGGSATTDGGIGMAAALGYRFFERDGPELPAVGGSMNRIHRIDTTNVDPRIQGINFIIACDVTNPLFGENGAAFVYGPQKGATSEMVQLLDEGLMNLSLIATKTFGEDISVIPGAGAAGGLGAGGIWFLNAKLQEGIQIVMDHVRISEKIQGADLVISGEGKVDEQTLQGKVIKGLAVLCKQHHVPLVVLCGTLAISSQELQEAGVTYAASIINRPMTLEQAQSEAFGLLKDATIQLVRLFYKAR